MRYNTCEWPQPNVQPLITSLARRRPHFIFSWFWTCMPLRTENQWQTLLRLAYPRHIILFEFRVKPWYT